MIATASAAPPRAKRPPPQASALALRLAHAENALLALTGGQVDAVHDANGGTYLLRPAQEQLRASERRLQAVIDSAPDVITVVNRGGVIHSQNGAGMRVLGYQADDLVGDSFFDLVHADDLAAVHCAFLKVAEGLTESAGAQFRHRDFDGAYRMIECTIGRVSEAPPARLVFSLRSTTLPLRSRPEGALPDVRPGTDALAKDRFLAMLSHELRTPLMPALLGVDELLEDERFMEAQPVLAMIRRNIELQSRLLEELSDFTGVGQGKLRLRLEPMDAQEAVRSVLAICKSEIAAARIEVLLNLRAPEPTVLADSARLQQVLWNLVKNAVKFSTPGSSISIAAINDPPSHLTIEVADHGIGIEPELLPLLFDPFQQGDPAMQKRFGGLGLGMFIAKEMTEAQGGTLTALSAGRGAGATFLLSLPLAPRPETGPANVLAAKASLP